jgi:hypothetical protein
MACSSFISKCSVSEKREEMRVDERMWCESEYHVSPSLIPINRDCILTIREECGCLATLAAHVPSRVALLLCRSHRNFTLGARYIPYFRINHGTLGVWRLFSSSVMFNVSQLAFG